MFQKRKSLSKKRALQSKDNLKMTPVSPKGPPSFHSSAASLRECFASSSDMTGFKVGIMGWSSPRFMETHNEFIDLLKKNVMDRGFSPNFFGLSGGRGLLFGADSKDGMLQSSHLSGHSPVSQSQDLTARLSSSPHYWLPSRDIIADQIEILAHEEGIGEFIMVPWSIDSLVGMLMATVRCGIPTIFLPCYSCWPAFEESMKSSEKNKKNRAVSIPYSQYSMLVLLEVIGLAKVGTFEQSFSKGRNKSKESQCFVSSHSHKKESLENVLKHESASPPVENPLFPQLQLPENVVSIIEWVGQRCMEIEKHKISPRRFFSQAAFHNAICIDMALGGSPDTVLHLSALANEAGVPLPFSVFNDLCKRVSQLAPMDRNGELTVEQFVQFGGLNALLGALHDLLQPSPTIAGKNIVELARECAANRSRGKMNRPGEKCGGIGILFGNIAQEGVIFRVTGLKESWLTGSGVAKVFDSESACVNAILSKKIKKGDVLVIKYCGPRGNPGMPYLTALKGALEQKGLEESVVVLTDGRPLLSGKTPAFVHLAPESAVGSTLSIIQDGDLIMWDFPQRTLTVRLTDTEIKVRLSRWREQEKNMKNSFLCRYSKYSSSSSQGAILV